MLEQYSLITAEQQRGVSDHFLSINTFMSTTGLYSCLTKDQDYQTIKQKFGVELTNVYEKISNRKFHESLNFIQKMGLLSKSKNAAHMDKVGLTKGGIIVATNLTFDLLPALHDLYKMYKMKQMLKEFVIGWLARINSQDTIIAQRASSKFYRQYLHTEFDRQEYQRIFEKFVDSSFPPELTLSDETQEYNLFLYILGASDLKNDNSIEKAKELGDYFGYSYEEICSNVSDVQVNLDFISKTTEFTGLALTMLKDVAKSVEHAKQYANYSIENDPYAVNREEGRKKIIGTLPYLVAAAATLVAGPAGDALLVMAPPVLNHFLNSDISYEQELKIKKELKNMKLKIEESDNNGVIT